MAKLTGNEPDELTLEPHQPPPAWTVYPAMAVLGLVLVLMATGVLSGKRAARS
jgi:uncharacterized membrane protein